MRVACCNIYHHDLYEEQYLSNACFCYSIRPRSTRLGLNLTILSRRDILVGKGQVTLTGSKRQVHRGGASDYDLFQVTGLGLKQHFRMTSKHLPHLCVLAQESGDRARGNVQLSIRPRSTHGRSPTSIW
jgi:hypothetical protein